MAICYFTINSSDNFLWKPFNFCSDNERPNFSSINLVGVQEYWHWIPKSFAKIGLQRYEPKIYLSGSTHSLAKNVIAKPNLAQDLAMPFVT